MSHPNFIDLVAGILEWDNKHVMIASAYFHHDRDVVIPELVELIDFCNSKNMALICCADTNAWSHMWWSHEENTRGVKLEEFIISENIVVDNDYPAPTYVAKGQKTAQLKPP